ncbi:hypothetical protein CLAIMM_12111 [Cladophialophora immunda]|nr:hypothetical protein CLAIMM_12111 [Cladophialophora immunda]
MRNSAAASAAAQPSVPASFAAKKSQILAHLDQPAGEYTDNSPKGTVDAQIRDLIDEINQYEGLVTTSSCAGRVAVFVEGPRAGGRGDGARKRGGAAQDGQGGQDGEDAAEPWDLQDRDGEREREGGTDGLSVGATGKGRGEKTTTSTSTSTSPGGKGGGRWLYVSHDPIPMPASASTASAGVKNTSEATKSAQAPEQEYFSTLFRLGDPSSSSLSPSPLTLSFHPPPSRTSSPLTFSAPQPPQLIHLSFSPLILHIHCATLRHARPLLAAAVNAGFRESGVQSLRALDDAEHGVMVAVRTAGLAFETLVGVARTPPPPPPDPSPSSPSDGGGGGGGGEQRRVLIDTGESHRQGQGEGATHRVVSEEYLALCAGVVNERFAWNDERRERFRRELKRAMERDGLGFGTAGKEEEPETRSLAWEDKDERRRRKREEGLERQRLRKADAARSEARQANELEALDQDQDLTALGFD